MGGVWRGGGEYVSSPCSVGVVFSGGVNVSYTCPSHYVCGWEGVCMCVCGWEGVCMCV